MIDLERGVEIVDAAERNFEVGNKVIAYFKGVWYEGMVVDRTKEDDGAPFILIRVNERVDDSSDALLGGYGLRGRMNNGRTLFAHEKNGKDEFCSRKFERKLTAEEIRQYKKDERECPF